MKIAILNSTAPLNGMLVLLCTLGFFVELGRSYIRPHLYSFRINHSRVMRGLEMSSISPESDKAIDLSGYGLLCKFTGQHLVKELFCELCLRQMKSD